MTRFGSLSVGLSAPIVAMAVILSGCSETGAAQPKADPTASPTSVSSPLAGPSTAPTEKVGRGKPGAKPTAARTTPAPGSISKTVAPRTQKVATPVKLGNNQRKGIFSPKVTAQITSIRHRNVRAQIPGEYPGPSILFNLKISNGSTESIDLNPLVVNVLDSSKAPANRITSAPATQMTNVLAPGSSAQATYVFVVPKNRRNRVTIEVTISPARAAVVFKGNLG